MFYHCSFNFILSREEKVFTKTKQQFFVAAMLLQLVEEKEKEIVLADLTRALKFPYSSVWNIINQWAKDGVVDIERYEYRQDANTRIMPQVTIDLKDMKGQFLIAYDYFWQENWETEYVDKIGLPRCNNGLRLVENQQKAA